MKRSEMLQIMKIASATGPSGAEIDKYLNNILTKMENAGMLPPTVRINATNEFMSAKELINESGYDVSSAWEDENED